MSARASLFQRILLPGFAFKAVVIGGGYATGRELVEFFFPGGPLAGLAAMALTMLVWSAVCSATFLFAYITGSFDYRHFFRQLLGRFWVIFETAYLLLLLLVLSVFGAAAGEIAKATFGLPPFAGMAILTIGIAIFTAFGNSAVELLFKYVSLLLYATYAIFVVLAVASFGDRISERLLMTAPSGDWVANGLTYAGYNLVGAIVILPVVRHFTSRRDAAIAGALCGPLAIIPGMLFFICMIAYYPEIGRETLPSDYLLRQLGMPVFHILFQIMVFAALLESGTGLVHAINERLAGVYADRGRSMSRWARTFVALVLAAFAMTVAARIGLIALIAEGYGNLAYIFLAVFVAPLFTIGVWRIWTSRGTPQAAFGAPSLVDKDAAPTSQPAP